MSPQPIPKDIEQLALKLANEEAERAQQANTMEGAEAIYDRLDAESRSAGFATIKEYIEALTKDADGVTPPEGTSPTSAFWSHGTEHPKAPLNWQGERFLDNRYIAEAWAKTQNEQSPGSARTLETTEGGRRLNEMYLFQDEVRNALGGADKGYTYEWARECWGRISETYAKASKGPVVVFAETAHTRSILYNQELPTLHAKPDVGLDNIHFAYAPPRDWPEAARAELGTNSARAQIQVDNPTLPHYVDPVAYARQDPVARKAALDAECAAVTAERTESAPQAPKVTQPSAEVPLWQLGFQATPVKLQAQPPAPEPVSTAPPSPGLGKESTGTGLG